MNSLLPNDNYRSTTILYKSNTKRSISNTVRCWVRLESYRLSKEAEIEEIRQQMIQEKKEFEMHATSYTNAIESYAKLQEQN